MWVGEIDVHDDDLVRRYWEAGKEADTHHRPHATFWPLQAAMVAFRSTTNSVEQHPIAAMDGEEVLGTAQLILPVLDNIHVAYVEPLVRPDYRHRGIGTALLTCALETAKERGRRTAIAEVNMPLTGPSPGHGFLASRGFTTGLLEIHRVLELPVDDRWLDDLAGSAAPHHGDYELVSFDDVVPDELMEGYCALQSAFNDEAPMGELDVEAEVWDADRVRKAEARFRRQGRHGCWTVAVATDGSVVALTEMSTTDGQPEIVQQGGTLVARGHRGHRLGLASKVANLRRCQDRLRAARAIHSWNAEENGPMVAINDVLGFRPVERLAEMQRAL